jgi:hypothetical protein
MKVRKKKKYNVGGKTPSKHSIKGVSREAARKKLDEYLRSQGFTSGRDSAQAPRYKLFQDEKTKEYIFRQQ